MPVTQYVYFALRSTRTTAEEMTARTGLAPDEVRVLGSRSTVPRVVPAHHAWQVHCRDSGLRVDDQLTRLLARIAPHREAVTVLARELAARGGSAALHVVRYFDVPGPDDPQPGVDTPDLFGWHLGPEVVAFLAATGAVVDVDEYDFTWPDEDDD